MPLDPKTQREQDAVDEFFATNSYLNEPSPDDALNEPVEPDPDEPHESEVPKSEELERRKDE